MTDSDTGKNRKGRIRTAAARASGTIARDLLRKDAAQYLDPGEQIQAIFAVKRPTVRYNDRAVVATDRRLQRRPPGLGRADPLRPALRNRPAVAVRP